jgi:hypothetical protein
MIILSGACRTKRKSAPSLYGFQALRSCIATDE